MPLWTPAQIATAAWWDASDASTISDTGGAVDQWNDKSGNGRNVAQSGVQRPTTGTRTLNSLNVIGFDFSLAQFLQKIGDSPLSFQNQSIFVVMKSDGATSGGIQGILSKGTTNIAHRHDVFLEPGEPDIRYVCGTATDTGAIAYGQDKLISTQLEYDGSSSSEIKLFLNGSFEDSHSFSGINDSTVDVLKIGHLNGSRYLNGYIAEIIICEDITVETRQTIEGYLAHKWGVALNLPGDHPYKSAAPIVTAQNGIVASVDYPNQRIYLGIGSTNTRLDTLDVFREVRTLRATTEDHRRFPPIIFSGGNVQKTADTATAKFVKLTAGTMIVPYDGNHTITLIRDTFTEDNISGTDVFDLTLLSPTTSVQIKEDIPQVEVITVSTGSGLDSGQNASLNNIEIIAAKLDSLMEDVSGYRFTQKALEEASCNNGGGGTGGGSGGTGPTAEEIAAAIINTIVPHP